MFPFGMVTSQPQKRQPSAFELTQKAAADALGVIIMLSDAYVLNYKELLEPATLEWLENYQWEQRSKWLAEQKDKQEKAEFEALTASMSAEQIALIKRRS